MARYLRILSLVAPLVLVFSCGDDDSGSDDSGGSGGTGGSARGGSGGKSARGGGAGTSSGGDGTMASAGSGDGGSSPSNGGSGGDGTMASAGNGGGGASAAGGGGGADPCQRPFSFCGCDRRQGDGDCFEFHAPYFSEDSCAPAICPDGDLLEAGCPAAGVLGYCVGGTLGRSEVYYDEAGLTAAEVDCINTDGIWCVP